MTMSPEPPRRTSGHVAPEESARSVFSKFRALLEANTAALTAMAAMERMRGGEYIFDRAFLETSARAVADYAHQAVYAVNAMTGNAHVALFDRFTQVAAAVEDILAGRPEPDDALLVRPIARLRLEDRGRVGEEAAALGELAGQLGLPVPRGFALSHAAWDAQGLTPAAREALAAALGDADAGLHGPVQVRVTATGPHGDVARQETLSPTAKAESVATTLAGLARAAAADLGLRPGQATFAALLLAAPPATLRGTIETMRRQADGSACLALSLRPDGGAGPAALRLLARAHPFARLPGTDTAQGEAAPLTDAAAALLAGRAMAAERLLGAPLTLGVAVAASGESVVEAVRLELPTAAAAPVRPPLAAALVRGGDAACLGAASGAVVHVGEATPMGIFPRGGVAVARSASPALAPVVRRAAAVVTEVGDPAGHLAAVARELRVPALFGVPDAMRALAEGASVTVDADLGAVFAGALENRPVSDSGLAPDDPEYLLLRRLLRRVATLTLTDPDAPEFSAAGCRSLHDILHFAHDRAVAALAGLRGTDLAAEPARRLTLPVPLDLRLLDIGGALAPGGTDLAAVRSRPLAAFLAGLLTPGMWDAAPARLGLGDMLGAMTKPLPDATGNLAIAARNYCNVSLRLGWHFTVVDAYLDRNPEKNAVYFRFAGGMAGSGARRARAAFLHMVLARLGFKVETAGDLVVARRKLLEAGEAEDALRLLGALCAFARQRDTGLAGEDDALALAGAFRAALAAARDAAGARP
jgi:pyruvate,water dikinase